MRTQRLLKLCMHVHVEADEIVHACACGQARRCSTCTYVWELAPASVVLSLLYDWPGGMSAVSGMSRSLPPCACGMTIMHHSCRLAPLSEDQTQAWSGCAAAAAPPSMLAASGLITQWQLRQREQLAGASHDSLSRCSSTAAHLQVPGRKVPALRARPTAAPDDVERCHSCDGQRSESTHHGTCRPVCTGMESSPCLQHVCRC